MLVIQFLSLLISCQQPSEVSSKTALVEEFDPLIDIAQTVVQEHIQMPDEAAEKVTVVIMPNGYIVSVRDPRCHLCFAITEGEEEWQVSHMGTTMSSQWRPKSYGSTMGHNVDIDNIINWFAENCAGQ